MSFQKDIAALIDCGLNRGDFNIWVACFDHNGLGSECQFPTGNQREHGGHTPHGGKDCGGS